MQNQEGGQSLRIEDSETLKNCMQMFADNVSSYFPAEKNKFNSLHSTENEQR